MKSRRIRKSSSVMSWILALALTLSPVMAQSPLSPGITEAVRESGEPTAGSLVPLELLFPKTGPAFADVTKHSTLMMAFPAPRSSFQEPKAPGNSKWIILAAIVVTGAVVGAILLFPNGGDKSKPPGPEGTVITAGTPTVTSTNR